MPESRRRKPKTPKPEKGVKVKMRGGTKLLRMRDENGLWVWRPLPKNDKETK